MRRGSWQPSTLAGPPRHRRQLQLADLRISSQRAPGRLPRHRARTETQEKNSRRRVENGLFGVVTPAKPGRRTGRPPLAARSGVRPPLPPRGGRIFSNEVFSVTGPVPPAGIETATCAATAWVEPVEAAWRTRSSTAGLLPLAWVDEHAKPLGPFEGHDPVGNLMHLTPAAPARPAPGAWGSRPNDPVPAVPVPHSQARSAPVFPPSPDQPVSAVT
jgi:hypothetical protein